MANAFCEEYRNSLLNQAFRLVKNWTDAQDLVQDTMVRAYSRQYQQRDRSTTLPWLRSILYTVFCNQYVKQKRRGVPPISLDQLTSGTEKLISTRSVDNPEHMTLNGELGDVVKTAIASLPEQYRACLLLCDRDGCRYDDIATKLNLTLPVVKSRIHRARARVRVSLIEKGYGI